MCAMSLNFDLNEFEFGSDQTIVQLVKTYILDQEVSLFNLFIPRVVDP